MTLLAFKGHLEIYVVGDNNDGSITLIRSFTNSFTSGSYYMTIPGRPSLHDVVEAGELTVHQFIDPLERVLERTLMEHSVRRSTQRMEHPHQCISALSI